MKTFLKENFFKFMIGLSALIVSISVLMYIISIIPPKSKVDIMIGDPSRIEKLEVAQYDFPRTFNFYEASRACKKLGSGWRLPTKNELHLLYKNKDKIGGFSPEWYVSRSIIWKDDYEYAYFINFETGRADFDSRSLNAYVRAVRSY